MRVGMAVTTEVYTSRIATVSEKLPNSTANLVFCSQRINTNLLHGIVYVLVSSRNCFGLT